MVLISAGDGYGLDPVDMVVGIKQGLRFRANTKGLCLS